MSARGATVAALLALVTTLAACGSGGSGDGTGVDPGTPGDAGCTGSCASATSFLSQADVERVLAQGIAEATARGRPATLAVVDRVGNVLGVFHMTGAATSVTIGAGTASGGLEGVNIAPDSLAAIAKAVTAAFLSTEGNAFSTRTAGQIIQEHFNPGESLAPGGPLFGVQFSQLPCSDLNTRFAGGPAANGPHRSPLGLAADPGGFPLYKGGTPVGAVAAISDGRYGIDRDPSNVDRDDDEAIALAASFGFVAPAARRADRITADGRTLRFSDTTFADLASAPASAPTFASLTGVAGNLIAVTGYAAAATQAGVPYGQPASGIRADAADYPGLDAFVLVDGGDVPRFAPRAGTELTGALTAIEVREMLRAGLGVANAARAQIRQPLSSSARVTISVVDSAGVVLGIASTRDAPVFGVDVSLQKARSAAWASGTAAAGDLTSVPDAVYLNGGLTVLRNSPLGAYVTATRTFLGSPTAFADGAIAFTPRAIGNLARPFYPDGADGNPPGPLSKIAGEWSPFSTGAELDLVYNALVQHVGFVLGAAPDVGANCTGTSGFDTGFVSVAPIAALANGLQIFPGGVPIYRDRTLVGAIGVSGDGVDQDDLVAFLGVDRAGHTLGGFGNAPADMRSDRLVPAGSRLRYVGCPQAPFLNSDEQHPCDGK